MASMIVWSRTVYAARVGSAVGERTLRESAYSAHSLAGVFTVGVDVGVFRELVGVVVDVVRVQDARSDSGGGSRDGRGAVEGLQQR